MKLPGTRTDRTREKVWKGHRTEHPSGRLKLRLKGNTSFQSQSRKKISSIAHCSRFRPLVLYSRRCVTR